MDLLQPAPRTPEELEAARPLAIPPEEVAELDEAAWYARVYRGADAPQLTVRAIVMGSVLGFFLSLTNLYVGLKTGWQVGVAITASILSFAIWTTFQALGLARGPMTILENTCMQTAASSAGYATGSTMMSAIPALLMLSATPDAPGGRPLAWPVLAAWTACLAVLGVTLAIPMKQSLINRERLRFPSGTAAAVTLQGLYSEGADALRKARILFVAMAAAAVLPIVKDLHLRGAPGHKTGLLPDSTTLFDGLGRISVGDTKTLPSEWNIVLDHSVMLVGAGAIVGLRVTASMLLGALVMNLGLGPHAVLVHAARGPATAWKDLGVWCGAPMLVTAGLLAFAFGWRTVLRALRGLGGAGVGGGDATARAVEVPARWFVWGLGASSVGIVLIAWRSFDVPPHLGALAIAMTFVLCAVAARATGETDVTPAGPLGKIMQLTYGVLVPQSVTANLMTAGITSGASAATADLLNDLKTGYLLGAHPRRQLVAQAFGIVTGTIATVGAWYVLVPDATALNGTPGSPPAFAAPAAQQWKAVAEVLRYGVGHLHPLAVHVMGVGAGVGVGLVVLERVVPDRLRRLLPSATGIGLGLVVPFSVSLSMFLGAALATLAARVGKDTAERYVVPIASGAIAGESIVGVFVTAANNLLLG